MTVTMTGEATRKVSVRKPRVRANMRVYILAHRIPAVASRRSMVDRASFQQRLVQEEADHTSYLTYTKWHSKLSGMLYIRDSYGNEIGVKPADLIRA